MPESLLRIRLTPRGGRDALNRYEDGLLHARVAAPPVDGAANRALLALLSDALDLPKSKIRFHSGETGRDKVVAVDGLTASEIAARLLETLKIEERSCRKSR